MTQRDRMAALVLALSALAGPASAANPTPRIRSGAIELGMGGSLVSVAGSTRAQLALRAGAFTGAAGGLLNGEVEAAYAHITSLDLFDLQCELAWQKRLGSSGLYPFVGVGGGVRREWLGSFGESRYPLGFGAGARLLASERVALRTEYRFRRVLGDPVADYTEHQLIAGLSILFRNAD